MKKTELLEKLPVSGTSVKDLDLIVDTDFAKNVGSIAGILLFANRYLK